MSIQNLLLLYPIKLLISFSILFPSFVHIQLHSNSNPQTHLLNSLLIMGPKSDLLTLLIFWTRSNRIFADLRGDATWLTRVKIVHGSRRVIVSCVFLLDFIFSRKFVFNAAFKLLYELETFFIAFDSVFYFMFLPFTVFLTWQGENI